MAASVPQCSTRMLVTVRNREIGSIKIMASSREQYQYVRRLQDRIRQRILYRGDMFLSDQFDLFASCLVYLQCGRLEQKGGKRLWSTNPPISLSSPPVATSTSLPSAVSGSLTDLGPNNGPGGLPGSNFQGGLPLYQPGGSLGAWGVSPPPPNANGSGLAMPMYWQATMAP
ncbi:hypothetical protein NC651_019070 [Populus alba x Populus x berolinensis]|nr:hypothetical protein NC651_019070 [Populus alba x Populus x berolinensis]